MKACKTNEMLNLMTRMLCMNHVMQNVTVGQTFHLGQPVL